MRTLTFGYLTLWDQPQVTLIEAAAAAGFSSVGLRIEPRRKGEAYPFQVVGNESVIRSIRSALANTGTQLSNVCGMYLEPHTTTDDINGLVDTAHALGARSILANAVDDDEERTVGLLAQMANLAELAGIRIAVEFTPYHTISSIQSAARIVERVDRQNVGLLPDALHLFRSGGSASDLASQPRERIFYAQICDASPVVPRSIEGRIAEARGGRLYPGEGGLPLVDFVSALPPECEIEIEVPHPRDNLLSARERAKRVYSSLMSFIEAVEPPGR